MRDRKGGSLVVTTRSRGGTNHDQDILTENKIYFQ